MPNKPREIIITEAEKSESIRKGTADLKAWRERNPDDYPGKGDPWADFLHHRARVLVEWRREGKTCSESAQLMSMDATQVSLILMSQAEARQ